MIHKDRNLASRQSQTKTFLLKLATEKDLNEMQAILNKRKTQLINTKEDTKFGN